MDTYNKAGGSEYGQKKEENLADSVKGCKENIVPDGRRQDFVAGKIKAGSRR